MRSLHSSKCSKTLTEKEPWPCGKVPLSMRISEERKKSIRNQIRLCQFQNAPALKTTMDHTQPNDRSIVTSSPLSPQMSPISPLTSPGLGSCRRIMPETQDLQSHSCSETLKDQISQPWFGEMSSATLTVPQKTVQVFWRFSLLYIYLKN